ncbi:MAG: Endodeoxyribonuclease RusA [Smithella sp. PtaU1.Bin162]|nr:MAG: Endodeoxyribonuclease RusA [Smithella sp. PtaU1.Bin162]
MNKISLIIPGSPIAKKRPRFFRRGNFTGAYNPQETEEGRFMWEVKSRLPEDFKIIPQGTPLFLQCIFCFPIPKSASKKQQELMKINSLKHTKKPDTDNCLKFVKDCLNSLVWHDDSQVYKVEAWKEYTDHPHTLIRIEEAV